MTAYLAAIGIVWLIHLLLALGLTLQWGLTGLANFGHVGFFLIGAYAAAILSTAGWPVPLGFAAGAALAALAAWPLGLVALRLRDDYFAIVTLGFSETVRLAAVSERWLTGGVQGIPGVPRLFPGLRGLAAQGATLALLAAAALAAALVIRRMTGSPFGRMLRAIRDSEEAVRALGKDPAGYKLRALVVGAALAAAAGAFYAHYVSYVVPDQFVPLVTFYVWMAVLMGGADRVLGAALGSLLLMAVLEGSRYVRDLVPGIPEVEMASVRLGLVGLALILFVLHRPQGIVGRTTAGRDAGR